MPNIKSFPKICISGSAVDIAGPGAFRKAYEVGQAIARHNAILVNGATTGTPLEAAHGAKSAGGMVIGFSPAISKREHVNKYKLPLEYLDVVVYTGSGYSGRNLQLTRAADAVVFVSGRIGTLNEFTIAFEDKKPIGVLLGTGGIIPEIEHILKVAKRGARHIVFDEDPETLVKKVLKMVKDEDRKVELKDQNNHKNKKYHPTAPQSAIPE